MAPVLDVTDSECSEKAVAAAVSQGQTQDDD